jgi:K(+)-stimulated pyrophosphate-energized sodium pump
VTRDPRLVAIGAVILGIVLAGVILWLTGYFTGTDKKPDHERRATSLTGAATVVLSGIGVGLESAVYTSLIIAAAVYGAYPARRRLGPWRCSSSRSPAAAC